MSSVQKFFLMGKKPLKIMKSPAALKCELQQKKQINGQKKNLLRKQNFHYNHNKIN